MLHATRRGRLLWLFAVFSLIVAACGSDGGEGDALPSTTTTAVAGAPATTTTPPPTTTTTEPRRQDVAPVEGAVMSVTYEIHPDAAWSDGVPVTAADFQFTFEVVMNPDNEILSRDGFDKVINTEVIDDKTFRMDFGEIYAPWQTLFATGGAGILPKHELEGQDFNSYWDEQITVGSGPFVFGEWVKDQSITLERNPNYWRDTFVDGSPVGDIQTIVIPFLEDSQTQVQALRGREIDMFLPQAQLDLVEQVGAIEGVTTEAGLGPSWEHIDFNHSDPLLAQTFIRQAIAKGIDRAAIVEALIAPIAPEAVPLNNAVWMAGTVHYEDHFSQYDYDPDGAVALLEDNGCVRGSDGVFECDGERLTFAWASTAGNEARELQFEIAQQQLAQIGIEVTSKFGPSSEVFAADFIFGDNSAWQIFNFGFNGSPDPAGINTLFYCEGGAPNGFGSVNILRYCNEEADALIRSTDGITDPEERAAVYNQADAVWLAEVPMIPLYQKPTFFAWYSDIEGPQSNATQAGPMWNVEIWSGPGTVVFAADQQPVSMNTWTPDGNLFAAGLVAEAVLQGAFTITPDFAYVKNLVEEAFVTVYK